MVQYTYKARDTQGSPVSGTIEARDQADALRMLQRDNLTVTQIRVGATPIDEDDIKTKLAAKRVKREEVITFATQLSVMLETGVPLAGALDAFLQNAGAGPLGRVMRAVSFRVTAGVPFSSAIAEFKGVFPTLMISLMRASEASGSMGSMLNQVAQYLQKERKTVRQIKGALTYPAVMILLALTVTSFLVAWVLPRFAKIYASREAALPLPTRIVMSISNFVQSQWWVILAVAIALAGAGISIYLSAAGRRWLDMLKLKLPVIGPMFTQYYITRTMRTLGTLLSAGVPLLDAIKIVKQIAGNAHWLELWERTEAAITSGQPMSEPLSDSWLIPAPVAQMITAGDKTGRLPEVLDRIADASENDLDEAIKTATQLIEPAMIVFMGLTIGGIAIALLLPIFTVANTMSK
ncbi:MAG: type II secretion system F family protein [Phycisphaerales bacterium]